MKPSILLVGTKQSGVAYLSMLLERAGYRAELCREPQTVDELLARNDFDLIFVDDHRPELNAAEVCLQLQARPELAGIPVVMSLPFDQELQDVPQREDGDPIVRKPILPHRFLAVVEHALESVAQQESSK